MEQARIAWHQLMSATQQHPDSCDGTMELQLQHQPRLRALRHHAQSVPVHAPGRPTRQYRLVTLLPTLLVLALLLLLHAASAVDAQTEPPANCSAAAGTCVRIGYFSCPWGGSLCSSDAPLTCPAVTLA